MTGTSDGSGSVCGRCAARGTACCEVPEGEKLATLSFTDIERIERASGLPAHRFVEREQLAPSTLQAYESARPIYRGMFVGGVRHGLKARTGACVFLARGQGCTLPPDARPLACRAYPFDFDALGRVTLLDAPHCLAICMARSSQHLLRFFETSQQALLALRGQMARECTAHAARLEGVARSSRTASVNPHTSREAWQAGQAPRIGVDEEDGGQDGPGRRARGKSRKPRPR